MANADVFGKKDEQTQSGFEGSGSRIASVLSAQKIASGNSGTPIPKVGTYTVRLGGKDYSLSTQQAAWIKQRYTADARTLAPAAVQATYTGTRLDSQLKEVGLPSSKYILDYMSAYDEWYGDGTTYTFSKDAQKSIGEKFKSTWQYDYTVEDQRRKKQGLAPVKVAAKYKDSYADSQLLEMGLPPSSDLGKYVEEYDTVLNETAKVNYLYDLATAKIMDKERELGGYAQLDDTARMAIFDEVYASSEFDDIRHLFQKSPEAESTTNPTDTLEEYEAKWAGMGKKSAASDEPVISWADFTAGYQGRKSKILTSDAAYSEDIADLQKTTTASLKDKDGVQQYIKSRGTDKAVDILADMFEARLPIGRIREAKDYLLGLATTEEEKKAIRTSVREIANAYTREHYSASENADKIKTPSERKAEREIKRLGDSTVKNGAVKQYDAGMTSAITVDVAEEIFNSHLVYGDDGKPTKESIALATNMLYEAGATTPIVLKVGKRAGMKNGILSKDYADTQKESLRSAMTASAEAMTSGVTPITNDESPNDLTAYNPTFATVVSERDLKQRKELMDASYQANVESGKMTRAEFYNAVRRAGWSDTIDIAKQAEVYYDEVYAPKFKENGEVLPSWEEIDQAAFTEYFANEKDLDPEIHKTTEEIVRGSLQRTFTSGVFEAISGAVSFADMATAKASGRTETWEFTKRANEAAMASEGVTSNQSFGSQVANVASTVAGQYTRMMIMSEIGSGVLSMFSKPAAAIGQALARTNAGNILSSLSSNVPAVSKGISAIVKGSKWAIQSTPFIATSMGSYYSEAIQGGASIEQAVPYATVCGLMEGAFEAVGTELWLGRMFGSQAIAKEIITAGRSVFKATSVYPKALLIRLVASTLGNALEEVGSYAVSIGMQKRTYNADAEFDWNEAAEQGAMGALIGLFGAGMNYSADAQLNIISEFLNSEAGQKWASEAGQSAVNDLMFMSVIAKTAPSQLRAQMRLQDNGTSTDEVSATVRNINQISRQMEDGQKKYDADMAKFDAELQAKKDALATIEEQMSDPSLSNKEYAKLNKHRIVALSELEVETAQVEAKRTERTKAFTEDTEQHKIDRHKAQQKLLGMSISVMDAFSSDIVALGNLARNKVTTVPNEIGNMIIAKMDAARAGRLIDFMQRKNEIQQGIQYESVKFPNASATAAEAAGAAQIPTGDNVVMFGQNDAESTSISPVAEGEQAVQTQPINTESANQAKPKPVEKSTEKLSTEERTVVDAFNQNEAIGRDKWITELKKKGLDVRFVAHLNGGVGTNIANPGETIFEVGSESNAYKSDGFVAVYEGEKLYMVPVRTRSNLYGGDFSAAYEYEDGKPAEQRMNLRDGERLVLVSPAELAWNHLDTPEQRRFDTEVMRMDLEAMKKDISGMRFFYVAKRGVVRIESAENSEPSAPSKPANVAMFDQSQPRNPAEPMGAEATISNKVATDAKPSSETMGIVDPRLQRTMNDIHRGGQVAYKYGVTDAYGLEQFAKRQNMINKGAVDANDLVQLYRAHVGTSDLIIRQGLRSKDGVVLAPSFNKVFIENIPKELRPEFELYRLAKHTVSRMTLETRFPAYSDAVKAKEAADTKLANATTEGEIAIAKAAVAKAQRELTAAEAYKNKPVLASETAKNKDGTPAPMDASEASALVAKIEAAHPEFVGYLVAQKSWWKQFGQSWLVDSGLWTQQMFDELNAKYPDYVPTYRVGKKNGTGLGSIRGDVLVAPSVVRSATGSTDEIVSTSASMAKLVERYVAKERLTEISQNLYSAVEKNFEKFKDVVRIIDDDTGIPLDSGIDFVSFDELEMQRALEVKDGKYIVRSWRNGAPIAMSVSKDIFDAYKYLLNPQDISLRGDVVNAAVKTLRAITKPMKSLLTGISPLFGINNPIRDSASYFMNTEANAVHMVTNLGAYFVDRSTNSEMWQNFLFDTGRSSGGFVSGQTIFEQHPNDSKAVAKLRKGAQAVGRGLSFLGEVTENSFRYAEYKEGIRKYGNTPEGRRKAAQMAADITVNFSRSGSATKMADSVCIYLNANVQGLDKMARQLKAHPIKTIAKGMSLAAMQLLLRYLFRHNENPHYQNLSEYTKDTYTLVPNMFGERDENGYCTTFIKLPRGRDISTLLIALTERFARLADGEEPESAFADFGEDMWTSFKISPNPFWKPLDAIKTNKNWYGGDVVPQYMKMNEAEPDQTTPQTTWVADLISKRLFEMGKKISPIMIDYIINQSGGSFYGKLTTGIFAKDSSGITSALGGVLSDSFIADPLYQSGVVSRFYDALETAQDYAWISKSDREELGIGTESVDEQYADALGDYQKQIAALYKDERAILAQEDDTPERKAKIDKIREQINEVANAGLALWAKRGK